MDEVLLAEELFSQGDGCHGDGIVDTPYSQGGRFLWLVEKL